MNSVDPDEMPHYVTMLQVKFSKIMLYFSPMPVNFSISYTYAGYPALSQEREKNII